VAFFVVFGVLVPLGACGTSAIGVDVCNQIESARCTAAAANGCTEPDSSVPIDLLAPFADGGNANTTENVAACIRFYSIACLHGLQAATVPSSQTLVNNCIQRIYEGGCAVVINPLGEAGGGACQWLEAGPPDAPDGAVPDSATDVVTVTDTGVIDTGVIIDTGVNFEACPEAGCLLP
jgi:hypothetical protein